MKSSINSQGDCLRTCCVSQTTKTKNIKQTRPGLLSSNNTLKYGENMIFNCDTADLTWIVEKQNRVCSQYVGKTHQNAAPTSMKRLQPHTHWINSPWSFLILITPAPFTLSFFPLGSVIQWFKHFRRPWGAEVQSKNFSAVEKDTAVLLPRVIYSCCDYVGMKFPKKKKQREKDIPSLLHLLHTFMSVQRGFEI